MEFLNQTMFALRGPTGQPQTAEDTIGKLADRLGPSTLLGDRRAAVLALKGLSRKHTAEVGSRALHGLLAVLATDASMDADIGRAALETLAVLCNAEEQRELGLQHTDALIAATDAVHTVFSLVQDEQFYVRLAALQLLGILLRNRRQAVQAQFLKAPAGAAGIVHALEDQREIVRTEALSVVQTLILQSADIQKVFAFEGAFDRLFGIITQEQGLDGGIIVRDALQCVDALLRFNSSNQSFFRETPYPPVLCTLLGYPPALPHGEAPPQEFALQFWDERKAANAALVIGLIGMLANAKGGSPQEFAAFTRCLVELGLASNAPASIKAQALSLLPTTAEVPLSALMVTAYVPVPDTNGEEWDRLEPASALDALVELILHGEYNGVLGGGGPVKTALELRSAALTVFEHFVQKEEIKLAILRAMLPPEEGAPPPMTPLLASLIAPPSSPLDNALVTSTQLAALLFTHLLRNSPEAKSIARAIVPVPVDTSNSAAGAFFVPADAGGAPPPPPPPVEDDEPPQSLLQLLSEHLSLAFLSRARADTSDREAREWDRLIVGYVCLLSQWLWEDPASVREFLEAGALGMLVEPINQTNELDVLVPGLCVFLLGVCYEFNREPGEATRSTIHAILTRLGIDSVIGRMARLREDERFKHITPETIVLPAPTTGAAVPGTERRDLGEIWFDWAFADFWKSNYHVIQKGIATDPNNLSTSSSGANAESAMLIASLRQVIAQQAQEIEGLKGQLKESAAGLAKQTNETEGLRKDLDDARKQLAEQAAKPPPPAVEDKSGEVESLEKQLAALKVDAQQAEERRKETEKEQEDLLVLLDELNAKRRRDKAQMREKGMEVSEDEEEEDGDGEE